MTLRDSSRIGHLKLLRGVLRRERKAVADLTIAMTIALLLVFLNLALNLSGEMQGFFSDHVTVNITPWIVNVLFFWLVALLVLAFRRWRAETRYCSELEDVISSINPDALLVVSPDRLIRLCNDSVTRIFGYSPEELLNQSTDMLYQDRRRDKSRQGEIHDALEHDGFHIGQATGKRMDGKEVPLEIITGNLSGQHGAVLLLRDITERVRAAEEHAALEQRIRQRQKLESLGLLAGGIAHDFNNLLAAILGNAELIMSAQSENKASHTSANEIKTAAIRAGELCQQLLSYSGRKHPTDRQPMNMTELVREMGALLNLSSTEGVTIDYDLAPNLPPVLANPPQVRQVIMNFMTNACEAAQGAHGHMLVRTRAKHCDREFLRNAFLDEGLPEGAYVLLEVVDDGYGMDSKTLATIFDPFFTTKEMGRGLGLAAVLGIVRAHGGCVSVRSTPGQGSTFATLWPAADTSPAAIPPTSKRGGTHPLRAHVLLVDDEPSLRRSVSLLLGRLGLTVTTAGNGMEAIDIFRDQQDTIDVVLLDMVMPRMNGQETMRRIRRIKPDAIVVMTSGYSDDRSAAEDEECIANAFLQKPYEVAALRAVLTDLLGGSAEEARMGEPDHRGSNDPECE